MTCESPEVQELGTAAGKVDKESPEAFCSTLQAAAHFTGAMEDSAIQSVL